MNHSWSKTALCLVAMWLSGCGPQDSADRPKGEPASGRLFGVSFQTMNNPFFVDLNAGLREVVEAHGDQLVTLDAQFNSLKQRNDISDLILRVRPACSSIPSTGKESREA